MHKPDRIASYPKSKVLALCEELGHDPNQVSQITIDPTWIRVEYMHPLADDTRSFVAVPVKDDRGDGE